jgi:hypothetical protein
MTPDRLVGSSGRGPEKPISGSGHLSGSLLDRCARFTGRGTAPVAQRIEHLTTDQKVRGSNPFGRALLVETTPQVRAPDRPHGPGLLHCPGTGRTHNRPRAGHTSGVVGHPRDGAAQPSRRRQPPPVMFPAGRWDSPRPSTSSGRNRRAQGDPGGGGRDGGDLIEQLGGGVPAANTKTAVRGTRPPPGTPRCARGPALRRRAH